MKCPRNQTLTLDILMNTEDCIELVKHVALWCMGKDVSKPTTSKHPHVPRKVIQTQQEKQGVLKQGVLGLRLPHQWWCTDALFSQQLSD